MSNFVFSLLIFHSAPLWFLWGECNVFSYIPVQYITLLSVPLILFCFVLLCSTMFFPHVSNCFAVVSLSSIHCCSESTGLKVAPAHTSTRHEAVRVWLESLSGGSTDLNGILPSRLRFVFYLSVGWPFPGACRYICKEQWTHKHACCLPFHSREFCSPRIRSAPIFHLHLYSSFSFYPFASQKYFLSTYTSHHATLHLMPQNELSSTTTLVFLALICELLHLKFTATFPMFLD